MHQRRISAAAFAVLATALLLWAGVPALAQGQAQAQASPSASASSSPAGLTNIGPSTTDPVATVNTLLDVFIGRRFDQVRMFACAASADDLDSHLNYEKIVSANLPAGMDAKGLIDSMTFAIPDRALSLTSNDGTTAVVHLIGTLVIDVNQDTLRPWVKQLLVAAGEDSSDASVDAAMATIVKSNATSGDLTRDITLTMDSGHWVICDSTLGASPSP
jgi:hypothetical protein